MLMPIPSRASIPSPSSKVRIVVSHQVSSSSSRSVVLHTPGVTPSAPAATTAPAAANVATSAPIQQEGAGALLAGSAAECSTAMGSAALAAAGGEAAADSSDLIQQQLLRGTLIAVFGPRVVEGLQHLCFEVPDLGVTVRG